MDTTQGSATPAQRSSQPLTEADQALIDTVLRFSRQFARRYATLAACCAAAGLAMLVLAGLLVSRGGPSQAATVPFAVATALSLLTGLTWRSMRRHQAHARSLAKDLAQGHKTLVAGVTRPAETASPGQRYRFADSVVEPLHPMTVQGHRLTHFAHLAGTLTELHLAPLEAQEATALASLQPPPRQRQTTRGVVTEVAMFRHATLWPILYVDSRTVRLKDEEFGGVTADQQVGSTTSLVIYR